MKIEYSLVHNSSEKKISNLQVNQYISEVENSIFELLDILGKYKGLVDNCNEHEIPKRGLLYF